MLISQTFSILLGTISFSEQIPATTSPIEAAYFEGRWALGEDDCNASENWTLIAGGIFVSEDLSGKWAWDGERLILNLTDLAVDEETGETGGRFQMDGQVEIIGSNQFK